MKSHDKKQAKIGLLYFDYVLKFFEHSHFEKWPNKVEEVTYHWKNDKKNFIKEVKRKKIDILVGSVPATAYEIFREISNEIPHVRFVPSLDAQFVNKSKENVTRLAWKYNISIPTTHIYYDHNEADAFLKKCAYPKVIKKSFGPSNYSGYFVHKTNSYEEARKLLDESKYHPQYIQDYIPMKADIRVVLMGHKPICAFWRRAPEGEWITSVSQGATVDYINVPKSALDLAVKTSKASNAEYIACDISYSDNKEVRLLEAATIFSSFSYLVHWIAEYIMWNLDKQHCAKPKAPIYNWEEIGQIDTNVLRELKSLDFKELISFSGRKYKHLIKKIEGKEVFLHELNKEYKLCKITQKDAEEWPSEKYNYQDNLKLKKSKNKDLLYKTVKKAPSPTKK